MLRGQSANCSCRVLDLTVGWKEEESVTNSSAVACTYSHFYYQTSSGLNGDPKMICPCPNPHNL